MSAAFKPSMKSVATALVNEAVANQRERIKELEEQAAEIERKMLTINAKINSAYAGAAAKKYRAFINAGRRRGLDISVFSIGGDVRFTVTGGRVDAPLAVVSANAAKGTLRDEFTEIRSKIDDLSRKASHYHYPNVVQDALLRLPAEAKTHLKALREMISEVL